MVIYRLTDRIPAKIGELTFWLSPLSYEQKVNVLDSKKMDGGVEVSDNTKRARLAIKYAVKGIDGVTCADGSAYAPLMDADGTLAWSSVDEVSDLGSSSELIKACIAMMGNISEAQAEGVSFDLKGVKNIAKKD